MSPAATADDPAHTLFNEQRLRFEEASKNVQPNVRRHAANSAALLRDSQGADALPLLAFTLERLFDERLQDKRLALADYSRMGGVKGAIEAAAGKAQAAAVAAGVPAPDLDTLLRRTFLPHLARINDAGEFARKPHRPAFKPGPAEIDDLLRDRVDEPRPVVTNEGQNERCHDAGPERFDDKAITR